MPLMKKSMQHEKSITLKKSTTLTITKVMTLDVESEDTLSTHESET